MPETIATAETHPEIILVEETGVGRYQVEVHAGATSFLVDEPKAFGGLGSGPNPYDLICAALGSCTVMTVRLYAERKGWPVAHVKARVHHVRGTLQARDVFEREIEIAGALDSEQRRRLMEIAMRCPVHLLLERGADVRTSEARLEGPQAATDQHLRHMVEACAEPSVGG
jgi:putative redox protein